MTLIVLGGRDDSVRQMQFSVVALGHFTVESHCNVYARNILRLPWSHCFGFFFVLSELRQTMYALLMKHNLLFRNCSVYIVSLLLEYKRKGFSSEGVDD